MPKKLHGKSNEPQFDQTAQQKHSTRKGSRKDMYCFLRGLWDTFTSWIKTGKTDYTISGHRLTTKEIHENCSVEISYCDDCGAQVISWTHGKFSDRHKKIMYQTGDCDCLDLKERRVHE